MHKNGKPAQQPGQGAGDWRCISWAGVRGSIWGSRGSLPRLVDRCTRLGVSVPRLPSACPAASWTVQHSFEGLGRILGLFWSPVGPSYGEQNGCSHPGPAGSVDCFNLSLHRSWSLAIASRNVPHHARVGERVVHGASPLTRSHSFVSHFRVIIELPVVRLF